MRTAFAETDALALEDVHAQRYLGCAMPEGKRLEIHGTPGNDLACYMDGGSIEVFGNAQDQVGNTMNGGEVVIRTDIDIRTLPAADREALEQGILLSDTEALAKLLEDYGS